MLTKRSLEGYLIVDDTASKGPAGKMESATITCSHCQAIVVLNPQRTRSRGYCPKCDHFVCDACEVVRLRTGDCVPFKKVIDLTQEAATLGRALPVFILPSPTP